MAAAPTPSPGPDSLAHGSPADGSSAERSPATEDSVAQSSPSQSSRSQSFPAQNPPVESSAAETSIPGRGRLVGLTCQAGHRFDAARQGYVNLLSGRGTAFTPDTAAMIMARERVQDGGIFTALSTRLAALVENHSRRDPTSAAESQMILDCGAGTGYYLHQLLEGAPGTRSIAIDLSIPGLKRAAKHTQTLALAWDLWRPLPLADSSVDVLLDVFAPRNAAEYARVLRPGGIAIVVTPREGHLGELRRSGLLKIQSEKRAQLEAQLAPAFGPPVSIERVTAELGVDHSLAADLVFMGPAGHHRDLDELRAEMEAVDVSTVTVDLDVSLWRR